VASFEADLGSLRGAKGDHVFHDDYVVARFEADSGSLRGPKGDNFFHDNYVAL
jgi:hypothetical protein